MISDQNRNVNQDDTLETFLNRYQPEGLTDSLERYLNDENFRDELEEILVNRKGQVMLILNLNVECW